MKPVSLLDTLGRRPFSTEEAELFVTITLAGDMAKRPFDLSLYTEMELGQSESILLSTLETRSKIARIDIGLACLICRMAEGRAGNLVLWAWTLHHMQLKTPGSLLSLDDFVREFPYGVPDEKAYSDAWDFQKFEGSNVLDLLSVWNV